MLKNRTIYFFYSYYEVVKKYIKAKEKGGCKMKFYKVLSFLVCLFFLFSGCVTPIGQLKESDFIWQERSFKANYQEIYRNIQNGFRTCSNSYFVGAPEGNLFTDIKKAHFDVFYQGYWGTKIDKALGIINITEDDKGNTTVKVGGVKPSGISEKSIKLWLNFAEGNYICEPE